jgi:hypothetical protein
MKLIRSAALGAAVFALAAGSGRAVDKSADEARPEAPTFAELDRNNNGYVTKAEAAADPALARDFDKLDLNHDGKLSRAEYLAARGKENGNPAVRRDTGKDKAKDSGSSSDGGSGPR